MSSVSVFMIHNQRQEKVDRLLQVFSRIVEIVEEADQQKKRPLVLTTNEAAQLMQISLPTLRDHFLCRPDFPKIKAGSKILIPYDALVRWLNDEGLERG